MPRWAEASRWLRGLRDVFRVGAGVGALLLALASGVALADQPGAAPRAPGEVPSLDASEAVRLAEAAVGRMVPDFEMRDRRGKPVRLSDYRGKPLLVKIGRAHV